MLLACVLALSLPLAAPAPAPEAGAATRLLVLDLDAVGVERDTARAIDPIVLSAAAVEGAEVLAQSELKRIAEIEASKAELGCDTSSCLAELAGAMGAQLVLFGTVSKLGSSTTVSLSLFDSRTQQLARDNVSVKDVGALADELPPRVRALVERGIGRAPSAPSAPSATGDASAHNDPAPPSALFMGGVVATAVGGAALLGGGGYAALNEATIQDRTASAGTKEVAQDNGLVGLIVAGVGALVAGAGVALLVVGGDA